MAKLTLTFEVHDDLTSEREAEYRETVLDALALIANIDIDEPDPADEENRDRADKMLNDWERMA